MLTPLLALTLACAKPWTLGAGPVEVPPPVETAPALPAETHTVKNVDGADLEVAVAKYRAALAGRQTPTAGILVLDAGDQPYETWQSTMVSIGALNGVPAVSEISGQEPLPALPVAGVGEEAADVMQQGLVSAGIRVVDLSVAQWSRAAGSGASPIPADLIFELRSVASDPLRQAQLRVIRLKTGEVVWVDRVPITARGGDALGRSAERVLALALTELAGG